MRVSLKDKITLLDIQPLLPKYLVRPADEVNCFSFFVSLCLASVANESVLTRSLYSCLSLQCSVKKDLITFPRHYQAACPSGRGPHSAKSSKSNCPGLIASPSVIITVEFYEKVIFCIRGMNTQATECTISHLSP